MAQALHLAHANITYTFIQRTELSELGRDTIVFKKKKKKVVGTSKDFIMNSECGQVSKGCDLVAISDSGE